MKVLLYDLFVVSVGRLTCRNRGFLRSNNHFSTNIKPKVLTSCQINLPKKHMGNVRHWHADSPVEVTEDYNGDYSNETHDRDELSEHIPAPSIQIQNKVPLALHRWKILWPRKLEVRVLQGKRKNVINELEQM